MEKLVTLVLSVLVTLNAAAGLLGWSGIDLDDAQKIIQSVMAAIAWGVHWLVLRLQETIARLREDYSTTDARLARSQNELAAAQAELARLRK